MSFNGKALNTPLIYKSNALIEASYRLSVYEQRIILDVSLRCGGTSR